jgi:S-DNA-T family DNA segregation ATPase FtsK/SpoIIIE
MCPVVKEINETIATLQRISALMNLRFDDMRKKGIKDVSNNLEYARILIVIDELADLMIINRERVEPLLVRIAQLGRAAGMHLLIATQSPRANVITGLIGANINGRIALKAANVRESVVTLNHKGAETLLGRGDAFLKLPDQTDEIRYQTAYISDADIAAVTDYWRSNRCTFEK